MFQNLSKELHLIRFKIIRIIGQKRIHHFSEPMAIANLVKLMQKQHIIGFSNNLKFPQLKCQKEFSTYIYTTTLS
ncbi:MAG TPA: hypothetical protein DCM62_01405 [Bacteroidales bacterium]|nr:hypothetical protein [Bacteroidales bacterium]